MDRLRSTTTEGVSLEAQVYEIEGIDLVAAFEQVSKKTASFYRRGADGHEMLAIGVACRADDEDSIAQRFARLRGQLDNVEGAASKLGIFGWTAFSDAPAPVEPSSGALPCWEAFSRRDLFVPEVLLRSRGEKSEAVVLAPKDTIDAVWQRWKDELCAAQRQSCASRNSFDVSWLDIDRFRAGVLQVTEEHVAPKVVLARRALVHASRVIASGHVLRTLTRAYPSCSIFALSPAPEASYPLFVGATPETLARVEAGQVETMALAGTAQSGEGQGPDKAADEALLESKKDLDEHRFVLDMITEALAPLCEEVAAEEKPRLHRLANVSHLLTHISGTLANGYGLADVVDALHPTPAVCGTPRELARELIGELEGFDRGLYAGTLGWMDVDGNGEFDVAIRCGLIDGRDALIYSGAGITAASDVDVELAETRNKFEPLLNAIAEVDE